MAKFFSWSEAFEDEVLTSFFNTAPSAFRMILPTIGPSPPGAGRRLLFCDKASGRRVLEAGCMGANEDEGREEPDMDEASTDSSSFLNIVFLTEEDAGFIGLQAKFLVNAEVDNVVLALALEQFLRSALNILFVVGEQ